MLYGTLNASTFSKKAKNIRGTETNPFSLSIGHYAVIGGMLKDKNWPEDEAEPFQGTLIIFGTYNIPEENTGYRFYLLGTSKNKMYYAHEWWGNTPKWNDLTPPVVQ